MCQESQKPNILSRDFSRPIRNRSDTNRQTDVWYTEAPHSAETWSLKKVKEKNYIWHHLFLSFSSLQATWDTATLNHNPCSASVQLSNIDTFVSLIGLKLQIHCSLKIKKNKKFTQLLLKCFKWVYTPNAKRTGLSFVEVYI